MSRDYASDPESRFSPREFLRSRRPELFSDTLVEAGPYLDRSTLEYHLETLTSRNQEADFETFARTLASLEICPNLLPHTGPTGGGDSKVDSETYPVSDSLTFAWYTGIGRDAASERWAFAFSAKKEWKSKVASDIKALVGTKRGYRKAFFISSRYIPDKQRAEAEDRLQRTYRLPVSILDRSWILDRVFTGHHEEVAIRDLRIHTETRTVIQKGVSDLEGERELKKIEGEIAGASQNLRFGPQFVSDCVEAVKLSRTLERPRAETEGRFDRARRAAETHGTDHQRYVVAYQWAWTSYWWFEDYKQFTELYSGVERLAIGTENAHELEMLHNLWMVLATAVRHGGLDASAADSDRRRERLLAELDRLSRAQDRPSTALHAKALALQVSLYWHLASGEKSETRASLRKLKSVVRQCQGLIGFPLEPFIAIVTELADVIDGEQAFDELFEAVVEVAKRRDGDLSAAQLLVRRGRSYLKAQRPYDAIRTLGRALRPMFWHESRGELVRALALCSAAYENVGLLWAARGTMLTAASICAAEFWTHSEVTPSQAACYNRIKWLELQLGRIPQLLAWHETDTTARLVLAEAGFDAECLSYGEMEFGLILGILFLKADLWQLKAATRLPEVLQHLRLEPAAVALWYALGHEERIPNELREGRHGSDLQLFMAKWRDQPAAKQLPEQPELYDSRSVTLSSSVLGCQVRVRCSNCSPCVEVGESVLAAFESLLSTGAVGTLMARLPVMSLDVRKGDFAAFPFSAELSEPDGQPTFTLRCADFSPHRLAMDQQQQIKDHIFDLLAKMISQAFYIREVEQVFGKLFKDERARERALDFTGSFVSIGNVLGHEPKCQISDWNGASTGAADYPLKRREKWDHEDRWEERIMPESEKEGIRPGIGEIPPNFRDSEIRHTEIVNLSLIRESLWNQAGWNGTVFFTGTEMGSIPALALAFKNSDAAATIFSLWRKDLGERDQREILRVSIVRGINKAQPFFYRVLVGTNVEAAIAGRQAKQFVIMSRMCVMEASSHSNLDRFLAHYGHYGSYYLCHASLPDRTGVPEPIWINGIIKRELHLRDAWQIGRHDADCMAIEPDDEPLIPEGRSDAPVLEVLAWLHRPDA